MAGIPLEIAAFFRFCTMANSITTALRMATVRNGAPQHTILRRMANGDCATNRLVIRPFL